MKFVVILALFAPLALAAQSLNDAASDAVARAEKMLMSEMTDKMINGATSRKGKKITDMSRLMGNRNALFHRANKLLASEEGHRFGEAERKSAISRAINGMTEENRGRGNVHRLKPDGFSHIPVESIVLSDDICLDDAEERVECTADDDMWRRIDGKCNNKNNPLWGSTGIPMRRMATPRYQDSIGEPFGGKNDEVDDRPPRRTVFGVPHFLLRMRHPTCMAGPPDDLPSAREVSAAIHKELRRPKRSEVMSHMLTQMGQFLDHDITFTPEAEHDGEHCCMDNSKVNCFAISIPRDDPFYGPKGERCMEFSRSEQWCAQEGGIREQMNGITAFVDASNVYGSDEIKAQELREGVNGMLKVAEGDLLPFITLEDGSQVRFAGDVRAREMPGLASMHTLFVREHNRIATEILNSGTAQGSTPEEIDENIYQRAKKAVAAQVQKIVYEDFLPKVLGEDAMVTSKMVPQDGDRTRYLRSIDPSILNEFATAAFRYGHSMIEGQIQMWTIQATGISETNDLRKLFFDLTKYEQNNGEGVDMIFAGLIMQASRKMDAILSDELTQQLFPEDGAVFGRDLAALNIQRGRDHGLPGYNAIRQSCGLRPVCSWEFPPNEITNLSAWFKLKRLYEPISPGDLDLFTVGLLEDPVDGGLTGPTFTCIMANQFHKLQAGDRFFYSHPDPVASMGKSNGLSDDQLATVKGRDLRDLICENTNVGQAAPDVFNMPDEDTNMPVSCDQFNTLDSSLF